jgi:hypothetical protein
LSILVVETGSEGFVGITRDPAVYGEVLSRIVGVAEQFRAEVAVVLAEQQGPIPGGAVGILELALPAYDGPEPPDYYVRGQMVISSEYLSSSPREVHACADDDRADYPPHTDEVPNDARMPRGTDRLKAGGPRGAVYDSGTAPICFIAPSRSYSGHSSTILPLSSKRSIWMPLISIRLPVGATPKNSPWWVPVAV